MQCHPIFASDTCTSLSLSLFRSIFLVQKATLVFGVRNSLQLSCPCQKQPFTNTHVLYFRKTTSGFPGSRGWFNLYLKPCSHRNFLTIISGFVFLERIQDMLYVESLVWELSYFREKNFYVDFFSLPLPSE